jgi:hypothetical protein
LSTIAGQVIQNIGVTALQTKVKQNFSLNAATGAEAIILKTAISTITNIITAWF